MSRILLITSSPRVESYSTRVARKLAEKLASRPGSSLTVRDLTRQPLPHVDDSFAVARNTSPDLLLGGQKSALSLSDHECDLLVEEPPLVRRWTCARS
jgi:FMN-dependent NADH-azoreductase